MSYYIISCIEQAKTLRLMSGCICKSHAYTIIIIKYSASFYLRQPVLSKLVAAATGEVRVRPWMSAKTGQFWAITGNQCFIYNYRDLFILCSLRFLTSLFFLFELLSHLFHLLLLIALSLLHLSSHRILLLLESLSFLSSDLHLLLECLHLRHSLSSLVVLHLLEHRLMTSLHVGHHCLKHFSLCRCRLPHLLIGWSSCIFKVFFVLERFELCSLFYGR